MTATEILDQLKGLGQESIKKVLLKHGIPEPLYGVKVEELKKIAKPIKNGYELSLQLFDTGVYDAMYLAGLLAEPVKMTAKDIQKWAKNASSPALREYTVAWVAAESKHGMELAKKWIASAEDNIASTGWATLSSLVTITADSELDMAELKQLLKTVAETIHGKTNRVKAAMNGFVIAVGVHVKELSDLARQTGDAIGKVKVDVGDTACKIPFSPEYIDKAASKNAIGKKKKSARCL